MVRPQPGWHGLRRQPGPIAAGRENVVEGIFERLEAMHSQIAQG
jgi:hypothetical protein